MDLFFEPLFASGRIIDLILLLVAVEVAMLAWLGRRSGRRPGLLAEAAPSLAAGASLLLTVRAALTDLWWGWVALALALALVAHLLDLGGRLRRSDPEPMPRRRQPRSGARP